MVLECATRTFDERVHLCMRSQVDDCVYRANLDTTQFTKPGMGIGGEVGKVSWKCATP